MPAVAQYPVDLVGTWTTKSRAVLTGPVSFDSRRILASASVVQCSASPLRPVNLEEKADTVD